MKNGKGFTLMEMLFVVLVVALIISLAMPAIRRVRFDIKNTQAKAALHKLAEARQSYHQYTRGGDIKESSFAGADAGAFEVGGKPILCNNAAAAGVPAKASTTDDPNMLFACGFLDRKDFKKVPYTFYICAASNQKEFPCSVKDKTVYVAATAQSADTGGDKYVKPYFMYVTTSDMVVSDNEE